MPGNDVDSTKHMKQLVILSKPAFNAKFSGVSSCVCLYRKVAEAGVTVLEWSSVRMLLVRYDVLHLHWPDNILSEKRGLVSVMKMLLLFLGMAVVRIQGRAIVWTSHNLQSHEQLHPRLERLYWTIFPRLLNAVSCPMNWISDQVRNDRRFQSVKHIEALPFGSWAGMYPEDIAFTVELGTRLGFTEGKPVALWFGLIRRYKGLEKLIEIFSSPALANHTLLIAGHCADEGYLNELKRHLAGCENIKTQFGFVKDEHVASYFKLATICVFPFAAVTNSGSARLALSFNRHILTPDFPFAIEFQSAFGKQWVSCYPHDQGLSVSSVQTAFEVSSANEGKTIEWGDYDWQKTAQKTVSLYRKLL